MQQAVLYTAIVLMGIFVLILILRSKRLVKAALGSMVSGSLALVLVNLLTGITGVALAYNVWTVGTAVLLGVPGVILMLVLNVMWR